MSRNVAPLIDTDGKRFVSCSHPVGKLTLKEAASYWFKPGSARWSAKAFDVMARLVLTGAVKEEDAR